MSTMGEPMARYAAARRVGDFVFMGGVVAVEVPRFLPGDEVLVEVEAAMYLPHKQG